MAYIVASNAPQLGSIRELKDSLIRARNVAEQMNREVDQMSDDQVVEQYGVPLSAVAAFRTTLDSTLTALQATAPTAFVSQVGFAS